MLLDEKIARYRALGTSARTTPPSSPGWTGWSASTQVGHWDTPRPARSHTAVLDIVLRSGPGILTHQFDKF